MSPSTPNRQEPREPERMRRMPPAPDYAADHATEYDAEYSYVTLGIDPGTGTTGYGVVGMLLDGSFELIACGVIRTPPRTAMHLRLEELFNDLRDLIDEFRPQALAVEKLFFGRNVTTAISVGQARGIVLLAAALADLEVAEYTPAEIKQAIAGYGNADKHQVQEMVQRILDLEEIPRPDDAADGVAVAVCHLQSFMYNRRIADAEADGIETGDVDNVDVENGEVEAGGVAVNGAEVDGAEGGSAQSNDATSSGAEVGVEIK